MKKKTLFYDISLPEAIYPRQIRCNQPDLAPYSMLMVLFWYFFFRMGIKEREIQEEKKFGSV